jgi:thymidylate synthase (FAD)
MSDFIKVLDKGYVELLDVMGSDSDICDAARCSTAGENVKKADNNRGLIRYMMRHYHSSPFEFAELKFRVKVPIFVWRQWIRHRTANVSEISGRYSQLPDEWYSPDPHDVAMQAKGNNQGGEGHYENAPLMLTELDLQACEAFDYYDKLCKDGVAREQARIGLPLSTYTVAIWKIDLHNLLHFLRLRLHSHAQLEIRRYAQALAEIVEKHFPLTWEAFNDFRLQSETFTWHDRLAIARTLAGREVLADDFPTKREFAEWQDKWADIKLMQDIMEWKPSEAEIEKMRKDMGLE